MSETYPYQVREHHEDFDEVYGYEFETTSFEDDCRTYESVMSHPYPYAPDDVNITIDSEGIKIHGGENKMMYKLYEISVIDKKTGEIKFNDQVTASSITHAIFKSNLNEEIKSLGYKYHDVKTLINEVNNSGFELKEED